MRHRKKGKKFGMVTGKRRSFLRILAGNLIRDERVETTEARAKAIRPLMEKLVTIGKKQDLAARRLLLKRLHNKDIVEKLYGELAPRYQGRAGGYLRVVKSAKARKRDGSRLAVIEFV